MGEETVDTELEFYKEFKKKIWTTKGCRFSANRRLERKQQASTFTLSILSIYVIAASICSIIYSSEIPHNNLNLINVVAIIASIFILVISNIEANRHFGLRAAMLLKSAQKLSEVYNEIDFELSTGTISRKSFFDIKSKYDALISDIPENHEDIDFYHFLSHHRKAFDLEGYEHIGTVYRYKFLYFTNVWGFYSVLLLLPPALAIVVLFK